jgi:O-antigen ligase
VGSGSGSTGMGSTGVLAQELSLATPDGLGRRRRGMDVVALLTIYIFLLIAIPSNLIFSALGGGGTPANLLGIVFLGLYLISWFSPTSAIARSRQPMRIAGLMFFCAIMLSYTSATRHAMPTLELNAADRGVLVASGWFGVLLLAADGIESIDRLKTMIRRIVFGVTGMALLGVTQFFTGLNLAKYIVIPGLSVTGTYNDLQQFQGLPRPSATAVEPIEFAAVLALALPLAIYQARVAPPERRLRHWIQVALIAVALPMTVSRTSILGFAVILVVLLPSWPYWERGRAYLAVIVSAVLLRALVPGLIGTLRNLFFTIGSDSDTVSRTSGLSAAGGFISQHPWFGRGFGTFLPQTYRFLDDQYLGSLIETGIFGFLILLALFATGWSLARRARRISVKHSDRELAQALAASVAVAAFTFATFDALGFPMATGLTFLILGCVGALWRLAKAENPAYGIV